jgi:hypothetical protein
MESNCRFWRYFREAEIYSFLESNVSNHSVEGRNHTVSAMRLCHLFGLTTPSSENYMVSGTTHGAMI